MTVNVKGYFRRIVALTSMWALMNRRKLQDSPKLTLHGIGRRLASIRATKVPKVPF